MNAPELSQVIAARIDEKLDRQAYRVVLNDQGKVRWLDRAGDTEVVLDTEPQTGWWRRFTVGLYRLLPIKGQLWSSC